MVPDRFIIYFSSHRSTTRGVLVLRCLCPIGLLNAPQLGNNDVRALSRDVAFEGYLEKVPRPRFEHSQFQIDIQRLKTHEAHGRDGQYRWR